jgi:hypothetical protein
MLALGAAHHFETELARQLYTATTSFLKADLDRVRALQLSETPLQLVQALFHQVVCGTQLGEDKFDFVALGHRCSLVALACESRFWVSRDAASYENADINEWLRWVQAEEKKRVYFAILFLMSATTTYCTQMPEPAIGPLNLSLPCDEALWEAEIPETWWDLAALHPLQQSNLLSELGRLFNQSAEARSVSHLEPPRHGSSVEPENSGPQISEFGCLALISTLNLLVYQWRHGIEIFSPTAYESLIPGDRVSLQQATESWSQLWLSFQQTPSFGTRYRLLANCVPLLDHAHMSFELDVNSALDSLLQRDYAGVNSCFEAQLQDCRGGPCDQARTSTGKTPGHLESLARSNEALFSSKAPREPLPMMQTVVHAAKAIETALILGPWWSFSSDSRYLPLHCASTVFCRLHILASWATKSPSNVEISAQMTSSGGTTTDGSATVVASLLRMRKILSKRLPTPAVRRYLRALDGRNAVTGIRYPTARLVLDLLCCFIEIFKTATGWPGKHITTCFCRAATGL